jgi:hypothetical protein
MSSLFDLAVGGDLEEDQSFLDYKNYGNRSPSYVTAADTLSEANGNENFVTSISNTVDNVQKFIGVSVVSGANQLYNIPASVGNMFGMENELSKTEDVLSSLDSDYSAFYKDHKQGADLAGFLVTSMIPGTLGVKVLNAGQRALQGAMGAGKFGTGIGRSMGLLVPDRKNALKRAMAEVASGKAPATIANKNALKAIGAGFGQGALEATFFEVAVAATMQDSPILEGQDFGDFVSNVAWGAGAFGGVFAAVDAAKISSKLKKAATSKNLAEMPWTHRKTAAEISPASEKIAIMSEDIHTTPDPRLLPETDVNRLSSLRATFNNKLMAIRNDIRTEFGGLANKDQEVADVMFNGFIGLTREQKMQNIMGITSTSRMGVTTQRTRTFEALNRQIQQGKVDLTDMSEEMKAFVRGEIYTSTMKSYGDDMGNLMKDVDGPVLTRNIDRAGEAGIEVTSRGVRVSKDIDIPFNLRGNVGRTAGDDIAGMWTPVNKNKWELDARYEWANHIDPLLPRVKEGKQVAIHQDDIPLLEKLYFENSKALDFQGVKIVGPDTFSGKTVDLTAIARGTGLQEFIGQRKMAQAVLLGKGRLNKDGSVFQVLKQEEIGSMVNMRIEALSGVLNNSPVSTFADRDLFARTSYADDYTNMLKNAGTLKLDADVVSLTQVPQHIRIVSDITGMPMADMDNNIVKAMDYLKGKQKIYQDGMNNAAANPDVLGIYYNQIPDLSSEIIRTKAVVTGAGPDLATAASDNYGTLANLVEQTGNVASRAIQAAKEVTTDMFNPAGYAMLQSAESAVEWAVINNKLQQYPTGFKFDAAGTGLIASPLKKYMDDLADGLIDPSTPRPILPAGVPDAIAIKNPATLEMAKVHVQRNGTRVRGHSELNAARGVEMKRDPDEWYPIPTNPKRYPHFAFVVDDSISGAGHSKMLYANSAEELNTAVASMQGLSENPQLRVLLKKQAEDYYKAHGKWEYEKTINKNYLDSSQQRTGTGASATVQTNKDDIVRDIIDWHKDRDTGIIREGIIGKNEVAFAELRKLGDQYTAVQTSKSNDFSLVAYAEEATKNPFADYISTALAVRNQQKYPWWVSTNRMADEAFSRMMNAATSVIERSKSIDDIVEVNRILEKGGYKGAAYDESMEIFANHRAAGGLLTQTVQTANSILATVVLRWDSLNAITNAVSANVLLGGELKAVQRAIGRGDEEAVGALAGLMNIIIPGTASAGMKAPLKLTANSLKKLNAEGMSGPSMQFYKDNGFMPSMSSQYIDTLEALTFKGDVPQWAQATEKVRAGLRKAGDVGEKWTGNKMAEEFNRFIAADVMKQITDVAVDRGLMGAKEQLAYINTFVNRTQGNYLASQRPLLFQGPVGQGIGLFQTYQFNLMQQLLRHVGEGHAKDAMTIMGLQGTIHGMSGLPAFNAINTTIVGNASGNTSHRDAYDSAYGIVGKEAGDWLMYGAASNVLGILHPDLKLNLYSRGDLNPRHLTIIPTSPMDVPFIQASAKFFGNIYETGQKMAAGGNRTNILLQGLEHNAISRPLAGIAQSFQALSNPGWSSMSTSKRGNVIASNDVLSLANLARMAGGKPLQEAIALDATYRFKAYGLKDARKRDILGQSIKSTMLAGQSPSQDQIEDFAQKYAEAGGRTEEFNNWMGQLYKTANRSEANKIQRSLSSPFSQAMQTLMGGQELTDFK